VYLNNDRRISSWFTSFRKSRWLKYGRYILAVVPLIWIFQRIDLAALVAVLRGTAFWVVPAVVVFGISLMFMQGIRWWVLLRAFLPHLSLSEVLSCHFKGIYYGIFLPTSAAQDVVRSVLLSKKNDYSVAWGATWLTRISGLVVMLLLSLYGAVTIDMHSAPAGMRVLIASMGGIVVLTGILSFSKRFTRHIRILLAKALSPGIMSFLEHIREGVYQYREKRRTLAGLMAITVLTQILFVVNAIVLIRGITGAFYIAECFMYIPLIEMICLSVPLTPSGIGVREGLSAMMFTAIGLPSEQLAAYVMISLGYVVLKLVGGIPVLYEVIVGLSKRSR
jgi:glycosyltransferase 2 family protein